MTRVGLQFSQEGIPLNRAADYQKVLDDQWPFLDIAFEHEFTLTKLDFPTSNGYWVQEILSHDLGYIPAFTYREISFEDNLGIFEDPPDIIATDTKIYARGFWNSGIPQTYIIMRGLVRVFACDITKEFTSPIDKITPRVRSSAQKYGVKILNPNAINAKISDTELSHFSMNTNGKALSIQQTGTKVAGAPNYNLQIDHNLGYPPTYFIAQYYLPSEWVSIYPNPTGEKNIIRPLNGQLIGISTSTNQRLTVTGAQSALTGNFAYLILKDPAEVAA
jgi:hypothetical protein